MFLFKTFFISYEPEFFEHGKLFYLFNDLKLVFAISKKSGFE